ncbi:MAG: DinB family protein [Leptospirales bacterium]|nr:DinB family protein [Leptospirales bacterium]
MRINFDYCLLMADYNQWMNQRLYDLCGGLSDSELRLDRGAFFKSIYSTLNHIVYGDLAFMSRFTGDPQEVPDLNAELFSNFSDLAEARRRLDARIRAWAKSLTNEWLSETLSYRSKVDGKLRTVQKWILVVHMFNHQTHHRGQITTLLTQLGLDIGPTDIPFMPQFDVWQAI